jgi:hypothetical protein
MLAQPQEIKRLLAGCSSLRRRSYDFSYGLAMAMDLNGFTVLDLGDKLTEMLFSFSDVDVLHRGLLTNLLVI